jgi:hypothetical protein
MPSDPAAALLSRCELLKGCACTPNFTIDRAGRLIENGWKEKQSS